MSQNLLYISVSNKLKLSIVSEHKMVVFINEAMYIPAAKHIWVYIAFLNLKDSVERQKCMMVTCIKWGIHFFQKICMCIVVIPNELKRKSI